jgi:hypothetical protein
LSNSDANISTCERIVIFCLICHIIMLYFHSSVQSDFSAYHITEHAVL